MILRNRPDVVRAWSDDDVARRWRNLFPLRREDDGPPAEPEAWELSLVTRSSERLAEVRKRLSSISWFMRCVAEPIARRANREDGCTGRFWEGRYKCQPLLDESSNRCLAYIDLNPIRAGLSPTPEESRFTSGYERIAARTGKEPESTTAVRQSAERTGAANVWNYENQPTQYMLPSGARVTMAYNADSHRTRKEN